MAYVVLLLICWNLRHARTIIYPFKLLTVAFHESWYAVRPPRGVKGYFDRLIYNSHAMAGTLTGAKITSMQLDPNEGGATGMEGGWGFVSLPAGS